jgi:hypothetical protein
MMAQEEVYNERDRSYSAWHRRLSTRRFIGIEKAQTLAMIDLDASLYVEYDDGTKEPLALIETARDVGQEYKNATVTKKLAERANIPCLVVLYRLSETLNPADTTHRDINQFRIKRLYPKPENAWRIITPQDYATMLVRLREYKASQLDEEATP